MGWHPEHNCDPDVTAGYLRTNAQWLSEHLKPLGFEYVHTGNGFQYTWGDPADVNSWQALFKMFTQS
jgi:hypothetical protein